MTDTEIDLHIDISDGDPQAGGPAVVFTHGWLNTGDVWDGVVGALAGSVTTATWDLRGHGRSQAPPPGQYSRHHALGDLSRVIDRVGRPAVLVGHSLGGYLSLAHAILSPDDVAGLVLVAAGPGFRSDDSREKWNDSVRSMAAKREELPEGMEVISMHTDSLVMDRMDEISVPVAALVGERDERFKASMAVFDKRLDVRHRLEVPDAGHMVHAKQAEAVAGVVAELVATVRAAPVGEVDPGRSR
jgi:pimeloyl-ACP methyl ester carboxylesterase